MDYRNNTVIYSQPLCTFSQDLKSSKRSQMSIMFFDGDNNKWKVFLDWQMLLLKLQHSVFITLIMKSVIPPLLDANETSLGLESTS